VTLLGAHVMGFLMVWLNLWWSLN